MEANLPPLHVQRQEPDCEHVDNARADSTREAPTQKSAPHDGGMNSYQNTHAPFQSGGEVGGMNCATFHLLPAPIVPPHPLGLAGDGRWHPRYQELDRIILTAMVDRRLKRIDQAVLGALIEDYGLEPIPLSGAIIGILCARHASWRSESHPNKIALCLKRLARLGYLNGVPYDIFRYGIDRKSLAPKLRAKILARDGFACRHCGSTENLQADHIVPRSLGGESVEENLQTLCQPCNRRKGIS